MQTVLYILLLCSLCATTVNALEKMNVSDMKMATGKARVETPIADTRLEATVDRRTYPGVNKTDNTQKESGALYVSGGDVTISYKAIKSDGSEKPIVIETGPCENIQAVARNSGSPKNSTEGISISLPSVKIVRGVDKLSIGILSNDTMGPAPSEHEFVSVLRNPTTTHVLSGKIEIAPF